ncbi:MAG: hypothetical protein FWB78_00610 [Treponema sp.]|nr:hypothetical protein [Treponema sp.]
MRAFLCSFGDFALAIPMFSVVSLTNLETRSENTAVRNNVDANDAIMHDAENRNTYISLPLLFNLPLQAVRHSIILKTFNEQDDGTNKNKIILSSPEVVREMEIPDAEIHLVPKVLSGTRFFNLFSGIHLSEKPVLINPVLVLCPEKLMQHASTQA